MLIYDSGTVRSPFAIVKELLELLEFNCKNLTVRVISPVDQAGVVSIQQELSEL